MDNLSLKAQKTKRAASARSRSHYPHLARTKDRAIVQRPAGGRRSRVYFVDTMRRILPQFTFNPKRVWWESALDQLPAAYAALSQLPAAYTALSSITIGAYVNLSAGAIKYLEAHQNTQKPWRARMLEISAELEPTHWYSAQLAKRIAYAENHAALEWREIETLTQKQPRLAQELSEITTLMKSQDTAPTLEVG